MTEMERMQAEAVNHARAMYRRRTPAQAPQQPAETAKESAQQEELPLPPEAQEGSAKSDLLAPLFEDKERTLILLLLILLGEEGADSGAMMALLYCIL